MTSLSKYGVKLNRSGIAERSHGPVEFRHHIPAQWFKITAHLWAGREPRGAALGLTTASKVTSHRREAARRDRNESRHCCQLGDNGLHEINASSAGGSELRFHLVHQGHQLLHFGHDPALFGEGRDWNVELLDHRLGQGLARCTHQNVVNQVLHRRAREKQLNDGIEGVADLAQSLDGAVFTPLRNPAVFASARLDSELHTVAWANGADLAPEFLHALVTASFEGKSHAV